MPTAVPKFGASRCQPICAPSGYRCTSTSTSSSGATPRERCGPRAHREQPVGNRLRIVDRRAPLVVVVEPEVLGGSPCGDPVHADLVELEPLELVEQRALLVRGKDIRLVDETVRSFLDRHERFLRCGAGTKPAPASGCGGTPGRRLASSSPAAPAAAPAPAVKARPATKSAALRAAERKVAVACKAVPQRSAPKVAAACARAKLALVKHKLVEAKKAKQPAPGARRS